ncbi:MAG: hypothetical protein KH431_06715 [Erysipelotrichaceae bacterium]|nr:hypothetical protein [Erysipelotrichaceae bacterium]
MNKKIVIYNLIFLVTLIVYVMFFGFKVWQQATGQIKVIDNMLEIYNTKTIVINLFLLVILGFIPDIIYLILKKKK